MRLSALLDFYTFDNVTPTNDPANTTAIKLRTEVDGITGVNRSVIVVPDSTVDEVIGLPSSSAKYLVIASDRTITIKLNGAAAQTLSPTANGKKTVVLYLKGSVTSLTVSNASGAAANIDVVMAT